MFESIFTLLTHYLSVVQRVFSQDLSFFTTSAIVLVALSSIEFKFPAEVGQTTRGRIKNFVLIAIYIPTGILATSVLIMCQPLKPGMRESGGILNSIFVSLAYLFVMDFFFYWFHRMQHRLQVLWAIHELHHSDDQLNSTTTMRASWLEMPLYSLFVMQPTLIVMGVDPSVFWCIPIIMAAWHIFVHSNIRLRLDPFTSWIAGPHWHRIHHSIEARHTNKNFAAFFPILDIVFGTYYAPARDEFPATGVNSVASNASVNTLLVRPYVIWQGLLQPKTRAAISWLERIIRRKSLERCLSTLNAFLGKFSTTTSSRL